jgi:hypothetical protein
LVTVSDPLRTRPRHTMVVGAAAALMVAVVPAAHRAPFMT